MNIGDYKYLRVTKKCVAKKLMIVTKYQASSCAVSPSPALSTVILRECSVAYVLLPLWSPGAHSCHSDNMALK